MTCQRRICGLHLSYMGYLTIFLYLIHETLSQALEDFIPGEDYPAFTEVPKGLSFTCDDKIPGYYADPETSCQVWHWCVPSIGGNQMYSFLCGIGTVFNQRTRVCDYFYKVDCQNAPSYYAINEDLYKDEEGNYIAGKK
ncbi:U-scoloptoxin(01)-Cw1a [Manduca sexta]|nr:U-scoloptoxin(01)-Cw1a [Manduca sexta]XP_030019635.1 U-scoloptoxin(01)-Cw1a [Manduca sexta]